MAFDESENVQMTKTPKTFKEWAVSKIVGLDFAQVGEPKTFYEYELAIKAGLDVELPEGLMPKTFKEKVMMPEESEAER